MPAYEKNFKMVSIGGVEHTEIAENVEDGFDATPVPPELTVSTFKTIPYPIR